jgi:high affinity cGMP-specific 3',5'-cyclic phosphodiesterase 9
MVAALSHDLGHFGVNNQYLMETAHELSIRYNDRSPLENMHCSELFKIFTDPSANVFSTLEKDAYKETRKAVIEAILHTDVTLHNEMVKELSIVYQMHHESQPTPRSRSCSKVNCTIPSPRKETTSIPPDILAQHQHTQLLMNAFLHTADVGNPMKPWEFCFTLANLCVDEFFEQGDLEKEAGIPVQMLNDRDKVSRPNSQVGFIEFIICPLAERMVSLFPVLDDLTENLGSNICRWAEIWVQETNPDDEVAAKTRGRAQKVNARCKAVTNQTISEKAR